MHVHTHTSLDHQCWKESGVALQYRDQLVGCTSYATCCHALFNTLPCWAHLLKASKTCIQSLIAMMWQWPLKHSARVAYMYVIVTWLAQIYSDHDACMHAAGDWKLFIEIIATHSQSKGQAFVYGYWTYNCVTNVRQHRVPRQWLLHNSAQMYVHKCSATNKSSCTPHASFPDWTCSKLTQYTMQVIDELIIISHHVNYAWHFLFFLWFCMYQSTQNVWYCGLSRYISVAILKRLKV